ncbi:hypothetical protein GJV07_02225 [Enterobacteriaceae bacterium RIT711]|nr:hypothetical protein [Enterobacteriaceae bacterium RIT711]
MAKTQQFNASVNFGATVDGSVGKTLSRLTGGIEDIGSVSLKTMGVQTKWMRDLQSGSASTASKMKTMEQATAALLKKQEALEKEIRESTKSGKGGTAALVEDYKKVGVAIKRATDEMEKLNKEQAKEQKRAERGVRFRSGASAIGHGLGKGVEGIGRSLMGASRWAAAGLLGGAAAAIASPIALNAETAESAGLAKSYGIGIKQYQGMGIMARQAGLNAENAGDLAEEFVNKLKEQGNEKTLNPMLRQIGLSKRFLNGKSREDAFNEVMSRLSRMKDTGAAASLADQLMGGEANKFLTYIHSTGKSFEQAMVNAQRYNLLTQEGADGAMKANTAVGNLWGVAVSGMEDTIGKITGQLAPTIDDAALQLADWIKGMQPKITSAVTDWLKPDGNNKTGPQRLWDSIVKFGNGVEMIGDEIFAVATKLKWTIPSDSSQPKSSTEISKDAHALAYNEGMKQADQSPLNTWVNLPWMFGGRKDYVDDYADQHAETFETMLGAQDTDSTGPNVPLSKSAVTSNNHNTYNFNVTVSPGMPEDMAQSLHEQFKQLVGNNSTSSPTFDMPG